MHSRSPASLGGKNPSKITSKRQNSELESNFKLEVASNQQSSNKLLEVPKTMPLQRRNAYSAENGK